MYTIEDAWPRVAEWFQSAVGIPAHASQENEKVSIVCVDEEYSHLWDNFDLGPQALTVSIRKGECVDMDLTTESETVMRKLDCREFAAEVRAE